MPSKLDQKMGNRGFVEISLQPVDTEKTSLIPRISVLIYLLLLMLITGYMAVIILSAHHLQHEVRDVTLTSQKPVTAATFIKYIEDDGKIYQTYLSTLNRLKSGQMTDAVQSGSDAVNNLQAIQTAYTKVDIRKVTVENKIQDVPSTIVGPENSDEDANENFVAETPNQPERTMPPIEATTEREKINQMEGEIDLRTCRLIRSVSAAENAFHRERADLLLDTGFGREDPRPEPLTDLGSLLGDFSGIFVRISDKDNEGSFCPPPTLLKAQSVLIRDSSIVEPLAAYTYFFKHHDEAVFFGKFFPGFVERIVEMPRQTLTVILVLIMGALGGAVDLLRRHLDVTQELNFENFIFMPILGMISGFAIFVLVKSGVLLIAEPNAGQQGATLSPYFVAFLGLISGLLAKEAIDSILIVGRRLFQQAADDVQRWYIGDAAKADDMDGTVRPIANLANISNDRIVAYLKGDIPTPGPIQMLISNQTGQSRRNIFTDLSPLQDIIDETAPAGAIATTPPAVSAD